MFITNTQLHTATPAQVNTTYTPYTHPCDFNYLATQADVEAYEQALDDEDEAWEDIFTDEELEAIQDDLFAPKDQRHLDRLSFLAVNELFKLPIHDGGARSLLEPELYDIIHSTLRMENALDLIDIWS